MREKIPASICHRDSVILDGSLSSDPDDGIVSYEWEKIAGSDTFKISDASNVSTTAKQL
jgi:hypothetical protein